MRCPHCNRTFVPEKESWINILGMSLNKYIAGCKAKFMDRHGILMHIAGQHDLSPEQLRRLEIGINARYGESKVQVNEYLRTRNAR